MDAKPGCEVIPFPTWEETGTIDSEADMVSWAVKKLALEMNRYSRKEAAAFGRVLWAKFQERAAAR